MVKVALLTGEYPPMRGGVADFTAHIARTLLTIGAQPAVITSARANLESPSLGSSSDRDEVAVFPEIRRWRLATLPMLATTIEATGAEVLNIQYQTGAFELSPVVNILPLYMRMRLPRLKVVTTFHDLREPYILPKIGPLRHLAVWLLAVTSHGVVVTNHEDLSVLAKWSGDGDIRVRYGGPPVFPIPIGCNIPLGDRATFDRAAWRRRLGVGQEEFLFGYFGYLNPTKGIDDLIAAFGRMLSNGGRQKLAMIGGSTSDSGRGERKYARDMRALLGDVPFRSNVVWSGYTSSQEVSSNLFAIDACVLPFKAGASLRHGTLIAAIAHDLPVVTTTPPSSAEASTAYPQLVDRENVLMVPAGSPERLSLAMSEVAKSPGLRRRLSEGVGGIAEEFRWDTIGMKTLRAFQRVLA